MNEDHHQNRLGHGNNLAGLRHMAFNVIQKEISKGSLRDKRKRPSWDENSKCDYPGQHAPRKKVLAGAERGPADAPAPCLV
jgi:hypothetical protein